MQESKIGYRPQAAGQDGSRQESSPSSKKVCAWPDEKNQHFPDVLCAVRLRAKEAEEKDVQLLFVGTFA